MFGANSQKYKFDREAQIIRRKTTYEKLKQCKKVIIPSLIFLFIFHHHPHRTALRKLVKFLTCKTFKKKQKE